MLSKRLLCASEEFSGVCRQEVCRWLSRDCAQCPASDTCDWQLVFGQQLSIDPETLRRHQKPALPFIFSISTPLDGQNDQAGLMQCGMVVVGRAITGLEMLLRGFCHLIAENNGFLGSKFLHISSRDSLENAYPLFSNDNLSNLENLVVMSADDILSNCPWECERLTIRLLSPLRLIAQGRQLSHFDFAFFVRSLMRRVSSLASYYCDYELNYDFKTISELACSAVCEEDHFGVTGGGGWKISGINGYGRFAGNFGGLLPILKLGKYVHAGKNASFGMGAYRLEIS